MDKVSLKVWMDALNKAKKKIFITTLLCVVTAALVSLLLPNIYQTEAIIYVLFSPGNTEFIPAQVSVDIHEGISEEKVPTNFRGTVRGVGFNINVYREVAMSPAVLKEVKDKVGLADIAIEEVRKKMLQAELIEIQTSFSTHYYAPALRLIVEYKDKKMAKDLANAWAQVLAEKINGIGALRYNEMSRTFSNELNVCRKNLERAEEALRDFKQSAGIPFLGMELEAKQEEYLLHNKTKQEIVELQAEIYEKQHRLGQLQREVDINKMKCDLLEQKRIQFKLSTVEEPPLAKVAAEAVEPEKHIKPKRSIIIIIAGIIGFMAGCLFSLIKK